MSQQVAPAQRRVLLLGPQIDDGNVLGALDELGVDGPLALVTAGWEERDGEDDGLPESVRSRVLNLGLFRRSEAVFRADTEVRAVLHERYDRLRVLQNLYRLRLAGQLEACRELLAAGGQPEVYGPEIADAVAGVQRLDAHHLSRVTALDEEIAERLDVTRRPSLQRHVDELRGVFEQAGALLVAGGHVAILLNRLRLFRVLDLAESLPILAWSGGAMVMGQRIVLFHDSPPQGPGDAEVLSPGLGLVHGVLPLPSAAQRLRLDDPPRVALFARRFAPDLCVCMDGGEQVSGFEGRGDWNVPEACRVLRPDGAVEAAPKT